LYSHDPLKSGRAVRGELNFPKEKLRIIEKWRSYPSYLHDVPRHKIVLQLDRSHTLVRSQAMRFFAGLHASAAMAPSKELRFRKFPAKAGLSAKSLQWRTIC